MGVKIPSEVAKGIVTLELAQMIIGLVLNVLTLYYYRKLTFYDIELIRYLCREDKQFQECISAFKRFVFMQF